MKGLASIFHFIFPDFFLSLGSAAVSGGRQRTPRRMAGRVHGVRTRGDVRRACSMPRRRAGVVVMTRRHEGRQEEP